MLKVSVGGEVDAFCTRCKMLLAHTVLAIAKERIARVRCNTCHSDHAMRDAPGSSSRSAGSTRASPSPRAEKVVISFETQLAEKDTANAKTYSPKDTYTLGQVIRHPTFGLGFVSAVRGDKVDITFKTAEKTLVHARAESASPRPSYHPAAAPSDAPADKPVAGE